MYISQEPKKLKSEIFSSSIPWPLGQREVNALAADNVKIIEMDSYMRLGDTCNCSKQILIYFTTKLLFAKPMPLQPSY
jgi:hypothetical protein